MLKISEIKTKTQFYGMQAFWDDVLDKSIDNNIFLTWEKMAPSVNYMEKNGSLKILCATEGDKLIGIAPFRVTRRGLKGHFGYGVIEPLTNGETDYTGLIMTEQQDECLHEFFEYLFKQNDWDLMYLPDLPQTSPSLTLMSHISDFSMFEFEKGLICPYISIPNSKEKLLAGFDAKFERKLRKSLLKLEREHGKVELKNYCELGSLDYAMDIFIGLHQKRWESKGEPGRFLKKKSRDITLQTAKYFARKGWLRLYFLMVKDKPVAAELNLEYRGKMYCHLKGFDTEYYRYRVGSLLTLKVLEVCVERGIFEYDFMQGNEAYKFLWTDRFRQNTNLKLVNKRFFSKLISAGFKVSKEAKFDLIIAKYFGVLNSFIKKCS